VRFEVAPGATPLDPDSAAGLIPNLATMAELNEFEERNIAAAAFWAFGNARLRRDYPNVTSLKRLHKRMFDRTWGWAGDFRRFDTNIGIDWRKIPAELHNLCGNVRAQVQYQAYPWNELAARFHHDLVSIHPFHNGNGRHARMAADLLLAQNRQPVFTWGRTSLVVPGETRHAYIAALQKADAGLIEDLLAFVRS